MILYKSNYSQEVNICLIFIVTSSLLYECIQADTLPETLAPTHSACYGTHTRFRPSCSTTGHVIAVKDLYVGAKLLEAECPLLVQEFNNGSHVILLEHGTTTPIDESKCCTHDANSATSDCTFEYDTSSLPIPYKNYVLCSGLTECSEASQVVFDITNGQCPNGAYPNQTNYMYMESYCIDETRTLDMCGSVNKTIIGEPLYLQNPGYPNNISSTHASCSCSVQSNICEDSINVYTVHVMMTSESGACKQRLYATDENSGTLVEWNCQTQTNFNITLNTVQERYFLINLENTLSGDGGNVWIGFEANHNEAILTINCPSVSKSSCTSTAPTRDEEASTGGSSSGGDGLPIIIGAAIGALLALIAIALLIYCCCCKKNKVKHDDSKLKDAEIDQPDDDIERSGFELLTSPHAVTGVQIAPANTRFVTPTPTPVVPFHLHETRYITEHTGSNEANTRDINKPPARLAPIVHPGLSLPCNDLDMPSEHAESAAILNGGSGLATAGLVGSITSTSSNKLKNNMKKESPEKKKKKKKKKHKKKSEEDKERLKENEEKGQDESTMNIDERGFNEESIV